MSTTPDPMAAALAVWDRAGAPAPDFVEQPHPRGMEGVRKGAQEVADRIARGARSAFVISWSRQVIQAANLPGKRGYPDPSAQVAALFAAWQERVAFVKDPVNTELMLTCAILLCLDPSGYCSPAGDCDDQLMLGSAIVSLGIPVWVRVRVYRGQNQAHVDLLFDSATRLGGPLKCLDPSREGGACVSIPYLEEIIIEVPMGEDSAQGTFIGIGAAPGPTAAELRQLALAAGAVRDAQTVIGGWPPGLDVCTSGALQLVPSWQAAAHEADDAAQLVAFFGGDAARWAAASHAYRGGMDRQSQTQQSQMPGGGWKTCVDPGWLDYVRHVVSFAASAIAAAQAIAATQTPTTVRSLVGGGPRLIVPGLRSASFLGEPPELTELTEIAALAWATQAALARDAIDVARARVVRLAGQLGQVRGQLGAPPCDEGSGSLGDYFNGHAWTAEAQNAEAKLLASAATLCRALDQAARGERLMLLQPGGADVGIAAAPGDGYGFTLTPAADGGQVLDYCEPRDVVATTSAAWALARTLDAVARGHAEDLDERGSGGSLGLFGDSVTPDDVLAYRVLWDPYVGATVNALRACADLWEAAASGLPAGGINLAKYQNPAADTMTAIANAHRLYADGLVQEWNKHAGMSDVDLVWEAANVLQDFQATVLKCGQLYLPEVAGDCPGVPQPAPPDLSLQRTVIARIEGLGILARGLLKLLGIGAGGALEAVAEIPKAAAGAASFLTSPAFLIGAGVVLVLAAGVAAAVYARPFALVRRAPARAPKGAYLGWETRRERDERVQQNIPPELLPLWERLRIKGGTPHARFEAFMQYVHDHPDEVLEAQQQDAERRMEGEIEARYGQHAGTPCEDRTQSRSSGRGTCSYHRGIEGARRRRRVAAPRRRYDKKSEDRMWRDLGYPTDAELVIVEQRAAVEKPETWQESGDGLLDAGWYAHTDATGRLGPFNTKKQAEHEALARQGA